MTFPFFNRLSEKNKRIYLKSDAMAEIPITNVEKLHPIVPMIEQALIREERRSVELASQLLCRGIADLVGARPPQVRVLAVRPEMSYGELHGLYHVESCRIQVWMRTLRHKRVVAFKTYLRTLLHELVHHFDYTLFGFPDSFHTEGFFKRESSLFHQLVTDALKAKPGSTR
jgi:hypothetical protein